jgi:outer membrane immunogenic protein
MKKLCSMSALAAAAALAFAGSATAADMAVKAPPAPPPPAFIWTGWYVGLNGGGLWGETTGHFVDPRVAGASGWQADLSQGLAGVTTGSNWQFGQFVIGTESTYEVGLGDFGTTNGSAAAGLATGPCGFNVGFSCGARIDNLFTIGVKLGWAGTGIIGNGNWLLFAQGGYARANIATEAVNNATGAASSKASHWHDGWFAGVGLDYALSSIVSVGIDYKHYEFNTELHSDFVGSVAARNVSPNADAVFARINFKIWGPGSTIPHW